MVKVDTWVDALTDRKALNDAEGQGGDESRRSVGISPLPLRSQRGKPRPSIWHTGRRTPASRRPQDMSPTGSLTAPQASAVRVTRVCLVEGLAIRRHDYSLLVLADAHRFSFPAFLWLSEVR